MEIRKTIHNKVLCVKIDLPGTKSLQTDAIHQMRLQALLNYYLFLFQEMQFIKGTDLIAYADFYGYKIPTSSLLSHKDGIALCDISITNQNIEVNPFITVYSDGLLDSINFSKTSEVIIKLNNTFVEFYFHNISEDKYFFLFWLFDKVEKNWQNDVLQLTFSLNMDYHMTNAYLTQFKDLYYIVKTKLQRNENINVFFDEVFEYVKINKLDIKNEKDVSKICLHFGKKPSDISGFFDIIETFK